MKMQMPLCETPGGVAGGAGGGGSAAPSGGGISGGGAPASGGGSSSHVSLTHDSLIQAPGSDKPVKYSDFIGGYVSKADFTRAQQEKAAEIQKLRQQAAEQEQRFKQAASQVMKRLGGGEQPNPNALPNVLSQLEQAPYVDGKTAAGVIRNLLQSNVQPLQQALQQRDQLLGVMFKRLQALDNTVGQISNRNSAGEFQAKLATTRQSLGLPDNPAINELLQDVYLSHTGEDLDREFPNLVKQRWDAIRALIREQDKKEADKARTQRLGIPGKGGATAPGRPLKKGFQTPEQIADALWPALGANET